LVTEVARDLTHEEMAATFMHEISRMSTWTVMFHHAASMRMGLNPTDLKSLGVLREMGPITAGELAELTGLTTGAITGVIDRLEKVGLVQRGHDAQDRRRVIIEPIANPGYAEGVGRVFGPLAAATISEFVERYTAEEMAVVLDFVSRGATLMKEQTARLQREVDIAKRNTE